jgi:hypothetical protein
MVLVCNSTVQHLGHDQAEVVINLALLFEDKRALASASAGHPKGGRNLVRQDDSSPSGVAVRRPDGLEPKRSAGATRPVAGTAV